MSEQRIRIVIADDHPIFREGLSKVIARDPRAIVVGEAGDGDAALERVLADRPDVLVLDLNMPGRDGFAVMRALQDANHPVKIILLTMHNSEAMFHQALDLGAVGYVLKDAAVAEIANAIRAVASGRSFISPELSTHVINRHNRAAALTRQQPSLELLTPTERRVLRLIAEHKTSKEIAAELFISVRTVEHHRAHICEKLNLRGFNSLVRFATAHRSQGL